MKSSTGPRRHRSPGGTITSGRSGGGGGRYQSLGGLAGEALERVIEKIRCGARGALPGGQRWDSRGTRGLKCSVSMSQKNQSRWPGSWPPGKECERGMNLGAIIGEGRSKTLRAPSSQIQRRRTRASPRSAVMTGFAFSGCWMRAGCSCGKTVSAVRVP